LAQIGTAGAQQVPLPAPIALPTLPPANATTDWWIRTAESLIVPLFAHTREDDDAAGRVSYFQAFEMQVETSPNRYRDVHLHRGTVINPRGATPRGGTAVDVSGRPRPDGSLDADTITVLR
jgi:hypothetical protein